MDIIQMANFRLRATVKLLPQHFIADICNQKRQTYIRKSNCNTQQKQAISDGRHTSQACMSNLGKLQDTAVETLRSPTSLTRLVLVFLTLGVQCTNTCNCAWHSLTHALTRLIEPGTTNALFVSVPCAYDEVKRQRDTLFVSRLRHIRTIVNTHILTPLQYKLNEI